MKNIAKTLQVFSLLIILILKRDILLTLNKAQKMKPIHLQKALQLLIILKT